MRIFRQIIFYLFSILLFLTPLILWPTTSEVFEFNKIVLVYIFTTLIVLVWAIESIVERKIIFRRTILDIPLLAFISSQALSTFLSIDKLTSFLGYYSRFNGGLTSNVCYSLLFWAFVSSFKKEDVLKILKYALLPSATLIASYGILEHFGIDKNIWVQDVQNRVFSTLGQPNWLASWLTALIPITWAFAIEKYNRSKKFWLYFITSILFFWTLIFTKSRSGLLGFNSASLVFWTLYFWGKGEGFTKYLKSFSALIIPLIAIVAISGTPWSPSIYSLLHKSTNPEVKPAGPALETGGTESGTIRKIVWKGAFQIFLHYPVSGTGPETFAYSYYKFRPVEHNLVSEWDFIYNKAHNEYLNFKANSGILGIMSYLSLIAISIYIMFKYPNPNYAFLAGYVSLLITNFFGFSVVPTQLELFLFPAFAISLSGPDLKTGEQKRKMLASLQKILIFLSTLFALYLLIQIGKYWYADTLFAKAKFYDSQGKPEKGIQYLSKAVDYEPNQALFRNELANAYTSVALHYFQVKDLENTQKFVKLALNESQEAINLSPANVNLKRSRFGIFVMLSGIDQRFLSEAQNILIDAIKDAPTDAKLYYNLGLTYARTGQPDKALETFKKTIELKSNYKEARLAYAILLIDQKDYKDARQELNYILKEIDPDDSLTKQTLESIK